MSPLSFAKFKGQEKIEQLKEKHLEKAVAYRRNNKAFSKKNADKRAVPYQ